MHSHSLVLEVIEELIVFVLYDVLFAESICNDSTGVIELTAQTHS